MHASPLSRLSQAGLRLLPVTAACVWVLGLTACASMSQDNGLPKAGRVSLGLPAGDWVDLGAGQEWLPATGRGPSSIALQSRAVGLRGSQGEVQAVVLVLANVTSNTATVTQWGQACADAKGMRVDDAAKGSPERVDCLRIKRRAAANDWLATSEPQVDQWLKANNVPMPYNATLVSHQFGNRSGAYVAAYVFADSRLLEPTTRNNYEFLTAGVPAVSWSRELAQAVRVSTGMFDGRLNVPPFPLPQPVGAPAIPNSQDLAPALPPKAQKSELPPLREPMRPERAERPDRS